MEMVTGFSLELYISFILFNNSIMSTIIIYAKGTTNKMNNKNNKK